MSQITNMLSDSMERRIDQLSWRSALLEGIVGGCLDTKNVISDQASSSELDCIRLQMNNYIELTRKENKIYENERKILKK
jgi:hypothetical protein